MTEHMTHARQRRLGIIVTVIVSTMTIGVLTGAGELALRYREANRNTVPGTQPIFYQHSRLHHALIRDNTYYKWVHVNRAGFRGEEVAEQKQPGTLRIMAVGGSTTFDSFVSSDAHTWPARLSEKLRISKTGRRIEVINAGVPGYRSLDNLIRLQTELHRYRPDIIILLDAHNDIFASFSESARPPRTFEKRPDEVDPAAPWTRWLENHSMLYTKVAHRAFAMKRQAREPAKGDPSPVRERYAEDFERNLSSFVMIAKSMGIEVVLPQIVTMSGVGVTHETDSKISEIWARAVPFATPDEVLVMYQQYNHIIATVAQRHGAVSLAAAHGLLRGRQYYTENDPIHFNDRGAEEMANSIAKALAEKL